MGSGGGGRAVRLHQPLQRAPVNYTRRFSPLRALIVLASLIACKDSSGPSPATDAANLTVHAGADQFATHGTAVPQSLAVRVTDVNDEPVAGATVTFTVKSGGGSITGATAQTNDNGVATAGIWTLGTVLGTNTVQAKIAGVDSVVFSATSRCQAIGSVALDASVGGTLATSDCVFGGGELADVFTFTTATQRAVRFFQNSSALDTYLEIYSSTGQLLAANDDSANIAGYPTSSMKMLLAPGTYDLSPSSYSPAEVGAYTVSVVSAPESTNTCELVFAMSGITTIGELAAGDCVGDGYLLETIAMVMLAGRTYTVTMTSATFDTYLELAVLNGSVIASNDDAVGTNARITFTPTQSNFFVIIPSSKLRNATGAFTLTIE